MRETRRHGIDTRRARPGEAARVTEQVDESDANYAVHVEDEVRLLARRDLLHLERVVEQRRRREVLAQKLLHNTHNVVTKRSE